MTKNITTTMPIPPEIFSKWQVPKYETIFSIAPQHHWCVVIPVINEGERLHNLLNKMKALNISEIADILIVDGGSNDGSLVSSHLQALDVHTLLIKTGHGKLSAQLRCAYSFALQQGYEGIVTIDGNDKDDPKSIPHFIDALQSGIDFVQGSRFIEGGIAENTPKSRHLAIQWIHAPFLSWASGFQWTDTTQGFRAYSRKMLLDPKIALFRNVFSTYELLAYLSYRAPRLGYRCVELPTTRRYPQGEVPTKISHFLGNLKIFLILIITCLSGYNPRIYHHVS